MIASGARGKTWITRTLSGRFLILTIAFVFIAEVLILIPSISKYRMDYMAMRLEMGEVAAMVSLSRGGETDAGAQGEILSSAGIFEVVVREGEKILFRISRPAPGPIRSSHDLRSESAWTMMNAAVALLLDGQNRVIRVDGAPSRAAGLSISILIDTTELRSGMLNHGWRILMVSGVISAIAGSLLFAVSRQILVDPIRNLISNMVSYAQDPQDARRIIRPGTPIVEIAAAEEALHEMQSQLTVALRQKDRLAQLGTAVAKISHDLRNILSSAQLFADRMDRIEDPTVRRIAPKLIGSITRAINLCEATLAFGRAEEASPRLMMLELLPLLREVLEAEDLDAGGAVEVDLICDPELSLRADPDQLFRILSNLLRNARQAMLGAGRPGRLGIAVWEDPSAWNIRITDNGPGIPEQMKDDLFSAFQGGAKRGGSGLGLSIVRDLLRGHGGEISLERTDPTGTSFLIRLPMALEA